MRAFIDILLLSGYCTVPRRRLHWATELDTYNKMVATTIIRNRFKEIMRFFHGASNANLLIEDKFAKVQPFFNILDRNFLASGHAFEPKDVAIHYFYFCNGYAFAIDFYQEKYRPENRTEYRNEFGLGGEVALDFLDYLETQYGGRQFFYTLTVSLL